MELAVVLVRASNKDSGKVKRDCKMRWTRQGADTGAGF